MSFVYVASPYSSSSFETMQARFEAVEQFAATFLIKGVSAYSPIVHCHELAKKYDLPATFGFWQQHDHNMILRSSAIYVLCISGWKESVGIQSELNFADENNLPILYFKPDGNGWYLECDADENIKSYGAAHEIAKPVLKVA